jgi:HlyD family secretion protein
MKKKIVAGVVLMIVVIGVVAFSLLKGGEKAPKYKTEEVARGGVRATVTATGTVNAVTTVLVGTQVSGTIKNIYVDFNSPVKKGQLLAQIDPATFEAQVQQARANLLLAQANGAKAKASLIDAKRTKDRNNQQVAVTQLAAANAQVSQARAALSYAETNLRYTRIVSPVDGTVISRNVDVGQTVAASFQTPTLFTIAQDLTRMQIDTSVDEADIGKVQVNQPVEFSVDAYPDFIFKGKVA